MEYPKDMKLYGLCLERLSHQVENAKRRAGNPSGCVVIEGYGTGDIEEIIEILELYDLPGRSRETLDKKLEELAEDASLFVKGGRVEFGYDESGNLELRFYPQ